MSYQVLARKYRPQNFDEVVGQEHVTETLKNAILKKRIHHAYLFTGVRGTGKTSLARIFAKSLECEKGPTVSPCGICSNCLAIAKGNFLDVVEIDGASNTSVDSVRELREQVKYVPAAGRYKIYLIDEVHMLSTSAFNALLKTLEEPPEHVLFLFATTEAHKIPVTILSRCQRFDLRRLSQAQILERLRSICEQESVKGDAQAFALLARYAEGSMRDAQSLLDMAIGVCGDALDHRKIVEMLGLAENAAIQDLTDDCLQGRLEAALAKAQELYDRGFDLRQIALQWVDYLHDLTLLKAAGAGALRELSADQAARMAESVAAVDLAGLQIAFQSVYRAADEIFRSETPKILFDLLLVRLVHGAPYQGLAATLGGVPVSSMTAVPGKHSTSAMSEAPAAPRPVAPPARVSATAPVADVSQEELLARALKKRPAIKAMLDNALQKLWEGSTFIVVFEKGSFEEEAFQEKRAVLAEALSQECGTAVKIEVRSQAGERKKAESGASGPPIPDDPIVQQAVEILGARVQEIKKL